MTAAAKEYKPEELMATVVNPKTGEILAMSNRPSFDPNIRDITSYRNPFVENSYELGSTMKIFTLAAAIDAGVYNGEDRYQSGSYKVTKTAFRLTITTAESAGELLHLMKEFKGLQM